MGTTRGVCADTTTLPQPDSARPIQPALILTGDMDLTKNVSAMRGQEGSSLQPTPWYLTGSLILTTRSGWVIPIQGVWSSPTSGYEPTYNAIGSSPRYKNWLTLHGGYRNLEFSPFTLAGHTMLGAGVELNPGLLRIGLMAGRFSKAVAYSETNPDQVAAFRRMGYCAKVGIGTDRTYLDVILLHAVDDARSIRTDSAAWLTPAENAVLGLSGRIRSSRKLTLELDAAGSAYTADTRAEPLPATDTTDNQFRYGNYRNGFGRLMTVNASTTIRTAVQASLNYRMTWADLRLRYKRVDPGYQSMGSYYQQADVERITVAPTIKLFKNRLQLRSSVGWQHDNLFNQKRTRTNRFIGSASLAYATDNNLTLDLTVSNYGTTQRAGSRPLNDTTRLAQNNRTLSGSVVKYWMSASHTHSLNASAAYQALRDLNSFAPTNDQGQNWNYNVDYSLQQSTAQLTLNVNYSYGRSSGPSLSFLTHGPTVRVEKKLGKTQLLCASLLASYLKNRQVFTGEQALSTTFATSLTLNYQPTPVHRLSVNGGVLVNRGSQFLNQQQGTIQYTMSF